MFRFPWSNFHELNLDWILEVVREAKEIFINGEADIQHAVETSEQALEVAEQAAAAVIADGAVTIPKLNNEVLKTTAYVIVGNRTDDPIPAGAYVYLRKSEVAGLSDGIYTAAANIPAGAIVTPAEFQQSTELHDAGALNVLRNIIAQLDADLVFEVATRKTYIRPNILDNGYFIGGGSQLGFGKFPINQRGQTSYATSRYTVDRWYNGTGGTGVAVVSSDGGYLTLSAGSVLSQKIVKPFTNAKLTMTVLDVLGDLTTGTAEFTGSTTPVIFATDNNLQLYMADDGAGNIVFYIAALDTKGIKAVKVEVGAGQTLAHNEGTDANPVWILNEIPNYGEELLNCQGYFQIFRTESMRPTYGADFRPVMATATPALDTLIIDSTTFYTASSES